MGVLTVPVSQGSPTSSASRVDGFQVLALAFPAVLRLPEHAHERPTFAVVLAGGFDKHLMKGSQECRPWTVIGEPAGERHANRFGPRGAQVLILQPDPSAAAVLGPSLAFFDEPRHFRDVAIAGLALRAVDELLHPDDVSPLALEGLGLEMLALAHRRSTALPERGAPPWLKRLEAFLHERFDAPHRIRALAAMVDRHPVHVARVFHAHHGVTVATYLRQLRIAWAQEQLRRSDATASEVALAAGFSDQSHFTRAFTRVVGTPPRRWRQRVLGRS
jgi:AraC family transcriptional regulator